MNKQEFYSSSLWRRIRNQFRQSKFYICECCNNKNMTKGCKLEVHHKQPIIESKLNDEQYLWGVALNLDNLELLCTSCHNMKRNSGHIAEGLMFNDNGDIVQIKK